MGRLLPNCVRLSPSLECRQDKVDNGDRYTLTEHSCWMLFLQLVLSLSLSSSTRIIEPGILSFNWYFCWVLWEHLECQQDKDDIHGARYTFTEHSRWPLLLLLLLLLLLMSLSLSLSARITEPGILSLGAFAGCCCCCCCRYQQDNRARYNLTKHSHWMLSLLLSLLLSTRITEPGILSLTKHSHWLLLWEHLYT